MNRREALLQMSKIVAGIVSAPTLLTFLQSCQSNDASQSLQQLTFNESQAKLVATIAELTIPETDTPGAIAAGVPHFIDLLITDIYPEDDRIEFLNSLNAFEQLAQSRLDLSFVTAAQEQQLALLEELEAAFHDAEGETESPAEAFVVHMKELTLMGYYTSQVGGEQELRPNPMGIWDGNVQMTENSRTYSW